MLLINIAHYIAYFLPVLQYTIHSRKENPMAFQIKSNKKESENKTIRFPLELIEQINSAIEGNNVSFSNFVIQACQFALDNMDNDVDSNSNQK
jgi:hypothetical protein